MKDALLRISVGTVAFGLLLLLCYCVVMIYSFLDTKVGYGIGMLFITSPIWIPIAYLAGDTIINFFRKKK